MGTLPTNISVLEPVLRRYDHRFEFNNAFAGSSWTRASSLSGETYDVYVSSTAITSVTQATLVATNIAALDQLYRYDLPAGTDRRLHFAIDSADSTVAPTEGENATWELDKTGTVATTEGRVFLDHFTGQTFLAPGHEITRCEVQAARTGNIGSDLKCDIIQWRSDYFTSLTSLNVVASWSIAEERFGTSATTIIFPIHTSDLTSGETYLLHFSLAETTAGGHDQYYSVKMQNSIVYASGTVYMGQTRTVATAASSMSHSLWMRLDQSLHYWNPATTSNLEVEFALQSDPSFRYTLARNPHRTSRGERCPVTTSKRSVNANLQVSQSDEKVFFTFDLRSSRAQVEELRKFWISREPLLLSYFPHAEGADGTSGMGHRHVVCWPGPFGYDRWEEKSSWDWLEGRFELEAI